MHTQLTYANTLVHVQGIERQSLDIFGVRELSLDIFTNTIFDLVFSGCFFSKEFFDCKISEIGYGRLMEVTSGIKKKCQLLNHG